jgi:prevent-host-death family protein
MSTRRTAGVADLKARLSEYLRAAKAGEEVVITERGRAVARIMAIRSGGDADSDRDVLVRAGILRPAKRGIPRRFWTRSPAARDREGLVVAGLLDERRQGR